jgi:hypothetical protein
MLAFLMNFLFVSYSFGDPKDLLPFEDLTMNMKGFGDPWNRYAWAMETYEDAIYVGTWHQKLKISRLILSAFLGLPNIEDPNDVFRLGLGDLPVAKSKGGEIWKYSISNGRWTQIVDHGFNDRFNMGYRVAKVYRDKIYFGSANYENGAQILAISNQGSTVTLLEPDDKTLREEWYANSSHRGMAVYKDKLYIGKENDEGAELWVYDGTVLKKVYKFDELSVGALCVFGQYLYAGIWDWDVGARLYRIQTDKDDNIISFDDMTPPEIVGTNNRGIMTMAVFQDRLFVGTINYLDGFALIRFEVPDASPGELDSYTILSTDGFGDKINMYVWSMEVFDNTLYLGTFNVFGPQLWYSFDGDSWEVLISDGFGSRFDWGIRSMAVADGRLFLGTASSVPASARLTTPGGLRIFVSSR